MSSGKTKNLSGDSVAGLVLRIANSHGVTFIHNLTRICAGMDVADVPGNSLKPAPRATAADSKGEPPRSVLWRDP